MIYATLALGGRSHGETTRTLETLRSLGLEDKRLAGNDEDGYDHNHTGDGGGGGGGGGHRSKHLSATRSMPSMMMIASQGAGTGAGTGGGGSSRWKLPRMHSFGGGSNITNTNNLGDGGDFAESGSERGGE